MVIGSRIQERKKERNKQTKGGRKKQRGEKKEVNCITHRQELKESKKEGVSKERITNNTKSMHILLHPFTFCKFIEERNILTNRIFTIEDPNFARPRL